jgi:FkbM family methyltransferase
MDMDKTQIAAAPTGENKLVWRFFDRRKDGFFVEVGANDPKISSQTWFLEEQGWRGVLVEPQARLAEKLRQVRTRSAVFQVACAAPGHPKQMPLHIAEYPSQSSLVKHLVGPGTKYVQTEMVELLTLDEVLERAGNPHIDFLSIDVEGTQLDVLRGFSLQRHRPALLFIEDHLLNLKVHRWLTRQGCRLVKRTGSNNWYVPAGRPFTLTTPLERLRLWKKVWANTPFRKLRLYLAHQRARRKAPSK